MRRRYRHQSFFFKNSAVFHQHDTVTNPFQIAHVMAHHHHTMAVAFEMEEMFPTSILECLIANGSNFIEKEHFCWSSGRDGKTEPETHANGVAFQGKIPVFTDPGKRAHGCKHTLHVCGIDPLQQRMHPHIFLRCMFFMESDAEIEKARKWRIACDSARILHKKSGDDPQKRGFAATVWTIEPDPFTRSNAQ